MSSMTLTLSSLTVLTMYFVTKVTPVIGIGRCFILRKPNIILSSYTQSKPYTNYVDYEHTKHDKAGGMLPGKSNN